MTTGKGDAQKPAHDSKVKSSEKDTSVELSVEELEERIAPIKLVPGKGN